MGPLVVDLVAFTLVLVALYARPTVVLAVLIGTVLIVPTTLITPHLHTQYATVDHLVIGAAVLRVAAMLRRGTMSRAHFHATPLHLALALLAATWAFAGIVFAPGSGLPTIAEQRMVDLGFAIAFFVVTLALIRLLDRPWLVMQLLTAALVASAGIAVVEHFTGNSWGHWLFQKAGHPGPTDAAHVLERRAGHFRVRSSGEFALAFSWICVMLLPVAAAVALRMRRWFIIGLPVLGIVMIAIYWTYSRSAAAAIPAALLLLALGARDRRTVLIAAAGVLGAVLLYAADPTIQHHLSLTTDPGSVGIRYQRLAPILTAVAQHPYLGLGLGGLQSIAVTTTDNFYLSAYGETGVVGAAVLVAVCATALAQTARGIVVRDPIRRSVIAASVVGFIGFLGSGLFDDALLLGQPTQVAMLLLAIGTATAEPELGFAWLPKWSTPRVIFMTASGAVIGLFAYLVAPVVVSQERTFSTVSELGATYTGGAGVGHALIVTMCDIADRVAAATPQTHVSCRDDFTAPGIGTLRVESPSATQTLQVFSTIKTIASSTSYLIELQTFPSGPPIAERATAWNTAPVSAAVLGFALAFIAPLPLRRRRPLSDSDEDMSSGAGAEPPRRIIPVLPPPEEVPAPVLVGPAGFAPVAPPAGPGADQPEAEPLPTPPPTVRWPRPAGQRPRPLPPERRTPRAPRRPAPTAAPRLADVGDRRGSGRPSIPALDEVDEVDEPDAGGG